MLTIESLWLSGRALKCGISRSEVQFLMGTQNVFFVPRLCQDEKYISLFLYKTQNWPSFLFYFQTPLLHAVTKTWTHHLQRQSHAKLNLYGFLLQTTENIISKLKFCVVLVGSILHPNLFLPSHKKAYQYCILINFVFRNTFKNC